MRIRQLIRRTPVTISEHASLVDAAIVMSEESIGSLVVCETNRPIGIITERDIVVAIADGKESAASILDLVVLDPYSVASDATVEDAAAVMAEKRIRHLLVKDGDSLVGVISVRDLMSEYLEAHDDGRDLHDELIAVESGLVTYAKGE